MNGQKKNPSDTLIRILIDDLKDDSDFNKIKPKQNSTEVKEKEFQNSGDKTFLLPENQNKSSLHKTNQTENKSERKDLDNVKTLTGANTNTKEQEKTRNTLYDPSNNPGFSLAARLKSKQVGGGNQTEAQLLQAENFKMAQNRIIELEKEIEKLRRDNEMLSSVGEIAKQRVEDFLAKIHFLEQEKRENNDQFQIEIKIYKDTLGQRDKELIKYRMKIEDLESRLASDLKKIRVRERELENRLELSKMEKAALVRAKDEAILDLKKKIDELNSELDGYRNRCHELNITIDSNHDQLSRTVKALRLALVNLEVNERASSMSLTPIKNKND